MGQKSLKNDRRALRRYAKKEKNSIVSHYMNDNWDKVLVSSVALIRSFKLKNRLSIAMTILFKPIKKSKIQTITTPPQAAPAPTAPKPPEASGARA